MFLFFIVQLPYGKNVKAPFAKAVPYKAMPATPTAPTTSTMTAHPPRQARRDVPARQRAGPCVAAAATFLASHRHPTRHARQASGWNELAPQCTCHILGNAWWCTFVVMGARRNTGQATLPLQPECMSLNIDRTVNGIIDRMVGGKDMATPRGVVRTAVPH